MIAEQKAFSVSQLTRLVKGLLEREFQDLTVEGEISNFRPSSTGHYYFSLKDKDSVISAVMFRNRLSSLKFIPGDGNLVRIRGNISVYPPRGSYQLICESMEKAGEGDILAMLEERKRKLASLGYFDGAAKRAIPPYPGKIAVITSPTGAALKDIMQVTKRRSPGLDLVILPVPVQGAEAGDKIAAMIGRLSLFSDLDAVIIGRGGGSLEDLLPFSDEAVVKAIFKCPIPLISAVGHEIDTSLADYAADMAVPTPSAAAELVCPPRSDLLGRIGEMNDRMKKEVDGRLSRIKLLLNQFRPDEMKRLLNPLIQEKQLQYDDAATGMIRNMKQTIDLRKHRVEVLKSVMEAGSPQNVLKLGYALIRDDESGKLITAPGETEKGRRIKIELAAGKIGVIVEDRENEKL